MSRGILFSNGNSRPPDGSRPTGAARVRELLSRDLAKYFLTGLPALLTATIYGLGIWIGLSGGSILITLAIGLVFGILVGPFLCGVFDTVYRTLRDEPGFWRVSYRKGLKQNAAQGCLLGGIFGLILAGQIFCLAAKMFSVLALISMVLLAAILLYSMSQIVLVRLGIGNVLRNALVLMTAHPIVTLKALAVVVVWSFVLWLLAPLSVLFWAVGGLWLPVLFGCYFLYPALDDAFSIESGNEELQRNLYQD